MRAQPPYPECKKVWGKREVPGDVVVAVDIAQIVLLTSQYEDTLDSDPFAEAYYR